MLSRGAGGEVFWALGLALWLGLLLIGGVVPAGAQSQTKLAVTLTAKADAPTAAKTNASPLDLTHLGDIVHIQADADSSLGIARVTFEIDDQFRAEAKQSPYVYDWDTLDEDDGPHTLAVTAYDSNGQTTVQRLKVTIDNQLSLGAKAHAARALEAFHNGDAALLEKSARKAYKISATDPDAARVMALNVGIKGDLNRAFQILDDQNVKIPPQDPATLEIRSYLLLLRAANAPSAGAMLPDLQAGLPYVQKQVNAAFEAAKSAFPADKPDFASQIARGDACFAHQDFETALDAYQSALKAASTPNAKRRAQHRVGLALIRIGRLPEAELMLTELAHSADGNATTYALLGAVQYQKNRYREARKLVQEGVGQHNIASLIVAALSDLIDLGFASAYNEAKEGVTQADSAETQYVAQAMLADTGDRDGAVKSFRIAFLRAPLFFPILVERGFDIIAYDKANDRFEQALGLFDLILRFEPDNAGAQAGRIACLVYLRRRKTADAALTRLIRQDHFAPDTFVLQSIYLEGDNTQEHPAHEALNRAHTLAPDTFKYAMIPRIPEFVGRLAQLRRILPLTPELLDRADHISSPTPNPSRAHAAAKAP